MSGLSNMCQHLNNPQNAIFELWEKHHKLIDSLIDRYQSLDPAVSREDLKQQSFIAFVEGLAHYDFTKGAHCQLSSYIYRFLQKEFHRLVPGRDKIVVVEDATGAFLKCIEYSTYEKRKREFQELGYRTTILSRIERWHDTSFEAWHDADIEESQDPLLIPDSLGDHDSPPHLLPIEDDLPLPAWVEGGAAELSGEDCLAP